MQNIQVENINGETYYSLTARGVDYTLNYSSVSGAWGLWSKRASLGRMNAGSFRYFKNLEELEGKIKVFRGISFLIGDSKEVASA